MMQYESKGSESQNQSSKKHDRADEKEEVIPFKKRARFILASIKEVSQVEIDTSTNKDKQIISSTAGHIDATKENNAEIVPNEESTPYDKDAIAATLSLLAMRKSRDKVSIVTSTVMRNCMKRSTGDKSLVDDDVSRKIHIGDGSGIEPEGDGGSHDAAPDVGDAKQVAETKEITEHEGVGGQECAPGSKEERNKGKKPVEYIVSTIFHDGKTSGVGEQGNQVHKVDPLTNDEGSSIRSPGDATSIEKDGGIREGDASYEEGQLVMMEDDDSKIKITEGKKPVDTDIVVYKRKQVHGPELVTNVVENSRHSPIDTAMETKNDEYSEGVFHEQEQVVAMEDVGDDDENNNRNTERVDDGVSIMIHDGGCGVDQVQIADNATIHEESSPVYTTIENMNDRNILEDNHEMEQQIAMNDVGDGSGGINVTVGEYQDRKGKRPIEYVTFPIIQDGASGSGGKEPEGNDNNSPIVSGATDREQLELELAELLAIPVRILKELERENNALHVGGEDAVSEGPSTNLTLWRSSHAIRELNRDDQVQQAAAEVPDGGNDNNIAISHGFMPAQGGGEIMMLDPLIIRTHKQSIQDLGEVSQQRTILTTKHGFDGGVGWTRSVHRANDHRLRFFGIDIPHVEEHEEFEIMQQQPKPLIVLKLLGFDIEVPEEELQAAATEIKDGESCDNHAPSGGGELLMQPTKSGLRLMGFDL